MKSGLPRSALTLPKRYIWAREALSRMLYVTRWPSRDDGKGHDGTESGVPGAAAATYDVHISRDLFGAVSSPRRGLAAYGVAVRAEIRT